MGKSATKNAACEDCFFRCNLLCALELDEPCATFRRTARTGCARRSS